MEGSNVPECEYLVQARRNVLSRLLRSIVNEGFAEGSVLISNSIPKELEEVCSEASSHKYWANIFRKDPTDINRNTLASSFSVWFPLSGMPLVVRELGPDGGETLRIKMLEIQDISFPIMISQQTLQDSNLKFEELEDILVVTRKLKDWSNNLSWDIHQLNSELLSCIQHQAEAYKNAKPFPNIETGRNIEWEQSVIEGHPSHPLHKSRFGQHPIGPLPPNYDFYNPLIHFFAVPRNLVTISGDIEALMKNLLDKMVSEFDPVSEVVLPVHEIQVPVIKEYFPLIARHLIYREKARAQSSLRGIILNSQSDLNFKLPLNIRISSMLRTMEPDETWAGEDLAAALEKIIQDKELLILGNELGGMTVNQLDPLTAKQFGCVVRKDPEFLPEDKDEKVIVCAALFERGNGVSGLEQVLNLNSLEKRISFLKHYVHLYFLAFIPPILDYGVLFEAHAQNVLARFKFNPGKDAWELIGYIIRDIAGIDVHETFESRMGISLERNQVMVKKNFYCIAYFIVIQMHMQQLVRALGLHYDGTGWKIIRSELEIVLPKDSELRRRWLETETASYKMHLSNVLDGSQTLREDWVPNLLLYEF